VSAEEFGERLCEARSRLEKKGRIGYKQVADFVREKTSRAKPHSETSVGRWFKGESFPDEVATIWALAVMFGVDPGWLAFGAASQAPSPEEMDQREAVRRQLETMRQMGPPTEATLTNKVHGLRDDLDVGDRAIRKPKLGADRKNEKDRADGSK